MKKEIKAGQRWKTRGGREAFILAVDLPHEEYENCYPVKAIIKMKDYDWIEVDCDSQGYFYLDCDDGEESEYDLISLWTTADDEMNESSSEKFEELSHKIECLLSEQNTFKEQLHKTFQFEFDRFKTETQMVLRGVVDAMEKIAKDAKEKELGLVFKVDSKRSQNKSHNNRRKKNG